MERLLAGNLAAAWRHIARFTTRIVLGILGSDGNDLVVFPAGVNHRHDTDCTGVDDRQGTTDSRSNQNSRRGLRQTP